MKLTVRALFAVIFGLISSIIPLQMVHADENAADLIRQAVNYWRGQSSYMEASMKIHRPSWERSVAFKGWTEGEKLSLVRFTAPPKDAGSASLMNDREMWSFSPKVNRVVKIPPSMMSQSWMGSDFSHSDLAKQADIIDRYQHKIIGHETHEGKKVTIIESIPLEDAAVVWGKEVLKVREDLIIVEREFYDQEMKLVKKMIAKDIIPVGERIYPRISRMQNVEAEDEWTEVVHDKMIFGLKIPAHTFTLATLSNPR